MTDSTAATDSVTVPVSGGNVQGKAKTKNGRIFNMVIGVAFLVLAVYVLFTGYTKYHAALAHKVTATTYLSTMPGYSHLIFPYAIVAAVGILFALVNFRGSTVVDVQFLFLVTGMSLMLAIVPSFLLAVIAQSTVDGPQQTASVSAWLDTNYHVQNYDNSLYGTGSFSVLDASGNKQTFDYQQSGDTIKVQHVANPK